MKTVYWQLSFKMWFTYIELLIIIVIIALISVIWVFINSNFTDKSKNTKITSDIEIIKNSLVSYKTENKKLPEPKWNLKFFDDSANYVHYDNKNAFWIYGNITEDTVPEKYLTIAPLDPRTKQYYAYWKTLTWTQLFEIAWVNKTNWIYESKVVWDYIWKNWPYNLIREYNWPDFVYDKSKYNFPYNPDERIVKWKIWSFSWIVKVNGVEINKDWILINELVSWDSVEIVSNWEAQIYYSDWSKSYISWQTGYPCKLTLANMEYKDKNNLFTKIQLVLEYWSIWTKTSKLDPNSEFEIYTTDIETAVRWSIFGIIKSASDSQVIVEKWKVEIIKNTDSISLNTIKENLKNWIAVWTWVIWTMSTGSTTHTYDITSRTLTIFPDTNTWNPTSATIWLPASATVVPYDITLIPILSDDDWLTNITQKIQSVWTWVVVLEFPSSFSWTSNGKQVYKNGEIITNSYEFNANELTLSWWAEQNYTIKVCDKYWIKCTKEVRINSKLP